MFGLDIVLWYTRYWMSFKNSKSFSVSSYSSILTYFGVLHLKSNQASAVSITDFLIQSKASQIKSEKIQPLPTRSPETSEFKRSRPGLPGCTSWNFSLNLWRHTLVLDSLDSSINVMRHVTEKRYLSLSFPTFFIVILLLLLWKRKSLYHTFFCNFPDQSIICWSL